MNPPAIPDRAGLQPERTALAWQRTAISASVAIVPIILVDARRGSWTLVAITGLAGLVVTGFALFLRRRVGHLSADRLDLSPWPDMMRVAVATVVLAALGVLSAVALLVTG